MPESRPPGHVGTRLRSPVEPDIPPPTSTLIVRVPEKREVPHVSGIDRPTTGIERRTAFVLRPPGGRGGGIRRWGADLYALHPADGGGRLARAGLARRVRRSGPGRHRPDDLRGGVPLGLSLIHI